MPNSSNIRFHFTHQPFALKNRTLLKAFIRQLFNHENQDLQMLDYVFCSDEYLIQLNLQFLKHDTYTDIITFRLSETNKPVVGEVYISQDRVKENAKIFQSTFVHEIHRVLFHGALHLCGYNDKIKKHKALMRYKEDFYLNQYFVPRETL